MIGTVFRSEDVPVRDRFDYWREIVGHVRSSAMSSDHAFDFQARMRLMELGPVTVWSTSFSPTRYQRSPEMVRHSGRPLYHLTLLLDGEMTLDYAGQTDSFGSKDWHMIENSQPYDLWPCVDQRVGDVKPQLFKGVGVDFPKELLPLASHRVRGFLGRRLSGREGAGALLAEFLISLERQVETLQSSDAPRLGAVVLELVSTWWAQVLHAESAMQQNPRQQALVERIRVFIRQNLHDPKLTPGTVAAAHHISLSYLHRIFEQQSPGETVGAWIRSQRLRRARQDLGDPSLSAIPIYTLAARWGITRASDFSRAFKAAYGISPKEHRIQALSVRI
ncbi:helix-turn-helix domain-containing protein [Streptomyces sp. WG7]|uniref:helix-turn-helix domain-containing protein n=1 Tax=Streptomyces sp. WG7 TaxID=3417650 RepID=UPI003CF2A68E